MTTKKKTGVTTHAKSLILAMWYLKAAKEYVDAAYSDKKEFAQGDEVIEAIKKLRPSISLYEIKLKQSLDSNGVKFKNISPADVEKIYQHMETLENLATIK